MMTTTNTNNIRNEILAFGNPEGFTFNIKTLSPQTSGYAVSLAATQNSFGLTGLLKVIGYAIKNDIPCIGGWRDSETGLFYYDATVICDDFADAVRLARENSQIAIFDITNNIEIRL